MEKELNYMSLPTSDVVKPTNEYTCDKIYKKIIKNFTSESIKKYYDEFDVEYKLSKIIKIEMGEETHYTGDTTFENGILKLPTCFFTTKIESSKDVIELIVAYPDLKTLLTIYGIYIVGFNKKDSKEERNLKNIIATYFASENSGNKLAIKTTANMTINGYATSNVLLENVIREIALIFGEDILARTLENGLDYLIKQIDEKTRKKGLGNKLITNLIELTKLSENEKKRSTDCKILEEIIDKKLLPMYDAIKHLDPDYQNTLLNLVRIHDFDFSILSSIEKNINLSSIQSLTLTESEKQAIRLCIHKFDKEWKNFSLLVTDYPEVKTIGEDDDGNEIYIAESFTFLNKVLSSEEEYRTEYFRICDSIQYLWQEIQEIIVNELIPKYIKNNKRAYIDLEEILNLSKYTTQTQKYDLSEKPKTRRLAKKLI